MKKNFLLCSSLLFSSLSFFSAYLPATLVSKPWLSHPIVLEKRDFQINGNRNQEQTLPPYWLKKYNKQIQPIGGQTTINVGFLLLHRHNTSFRNNLFLTNIFGIPNLFNKTLLSF